MNRNIVKKIVHMMGAMLIHVEDTEERHIAVHMNQKHLSLFNPPYHQPLLDGPRPGTLTQ